MAFHEVPGEGDVFICRVACAGLPSTWQAVVVLLEAVITIRVDHFKSECTLLWQTVNVSVFNDPGMEIRMSLFIRNSNAVT